MKGDEEAAAARVVDLPQARDHARNSGGQEGPAETERAFDARNGCPRRCGRRRGRPPSSARRAHEPGREGRTLRSRSLRESGAKRSRANEGASVLPEAWPAKCTTVLARGAPRKAVLRGLAAGEELGLAVQGSDLLPPPRPPADWADRPIAVDRPVGCRRRGREVGAAQGPRTAGGLHEDRPARGHPQNVVFDEVASRCPVPEAGEGHPLQDSIRDEDEGPLGSDERSRAEHELVVETSRRPAYDVHGGTALQGRPVGRHQARQLGRRQRALDEMGPLAGEHPAHRAILEDHEVHESEAVWQLPPQGLEVERSNGLPRQGIDHLARSATFDECERTLRIVAPSSCRRTMSSKSGRAWSKKEI